MITKYKTYIKKFVSLLLKKKIKYHEVSKFLNTNDLFFDVGAHLGEKSKELIKNNINVIMIEPQPECLKQLNKLYKFLSCSSELCRTSVRMSALTCKAAGLVPPFARARGGCTNALMFANSTAAASESLSFPALCRFLAGLFES